MDLTARVTALEEEVNVLKGEIKLILQEVRTAVLARDNPFAGGGLDSVAGAAPSPAVLPAFSPPDSGPVFAETSNGHSAAVRPEPETQADPPSPIRPVVSATPPAVNGTKAEVVWQAGEEAERPRRWSVHSLAALMSWTQESAQRFSKQDLGIVLSLARYGGLIDKDLETTLAELAEGLAPEEKPLRAGSNDFLLALRQLDALLDEAGQTHRIEQPARRAS
ncbi:MAG TPA: hypothetical protein VJB57_04590, partial [Dehalococcoidia bacterium]|nr:hypothetical protein [Dehalococcoidia bacterium]